MREVLVIRSPDGRTAATVCPGHGALVASLVMPIRGQSRELLFRRGWFWDSIVDGGGNPFLFPVVGRHRSGDQADTYTRDGVSYPMPMHGFSLRQAWQVDEAGDRHVVVSLRDDDSTRTHFPFSFSVTLHYEVGNGSFTCRQTYRNRGGEPMPLAAGFHPYFALSPDEVEACEVHGEFDAVGTYNETYTDIARWEPAPPTVNAAAMARGSHALRLRDPRAVDLTVRGEPLLSMRLRERGEHLPFRYLQFYRSGHDAFVCVEPWMDLPNALNRGGVRAIDGEATVSFALVAPEG